MTEFSVFWLVKTFALLKVFMVALARICLLVDLRDFFRAFPENYSRRVCKSTNKKNLALIKW